MKANQTAVISGASSGIGAATALEFAKNGFDLLLLGRDQEKLNHTQKLCIDFNKQIKIDTYSSDILKIEESVMVTKLSQLSQPVALINNAGVYLQKPFESTSLDQWIKLFNTNLLGSIHLTQILWPFFLKASAGSIVNVSSTLGLKPIANTSAYSALKAALINWTQSLAIEGGSHNIRVNCVCPGIIDTPIHPFHSDSPQKERVIKNLTSVQLLKNLGQASDVAHAIYFLASTSSKFTTGSTLNVDGGINIK